jgi:Uma2 family endonuclease
MTSVVEKKTYTFKDYQALPEGVPYQLIAGDLIMTPSPAPYYQDILRNLGLALASFVKERGLGKVYLAPLDVYLTEKDAYQPDIMFISKDRLNIIGESRIEGAPDVVVEILSPATAYYDLRTKKDVYEKSGVKEYWVVDPLQHSVEIFENKKGHLELVSAVKGEGEARSKQIGAFHVLLKEIFE